MKIEGKLTFKSERADELVSIIARSLAPDNVSEMETVIDDNEVKVKFKGNKVGTVLSSVDDYLMNAKIASDMLNIK
jgi:hypothetical protein